MATSTYNLIASQTVGSGGASSVTFSSIPQTYTDLKLTFSIRGTQSSDLQDNSLITLSGSTSYSSKLLFGQGSGSPSSASTSTTSLNLSEYHPSGGATGSTFGNGELYIPNYANTSYNKSISSDFVIENNGTATFMGLSAGLSSYTGAVTSITFTPVSGDSYAQYSTFYLYGIKNS